MQSTMTNGPKISQPVNGSNATDNPLQSDSDDIRKNIILALDSYYMSGGHNSLKDLVNERDQLRKRVSENETLLQSQEEANKLVQDTFHKTITDGHDRHQNETKALQASLNSWKKAAEENKEQMLELKRQHEKTLSDLEKKHENEVSDLEKNIKQLKDAGKKAKEAYEKANAGLKEKSTEIENLNAKLLKDQNKIKEMSEELETRGKEIVKLKNSEKSLKANYDDLREAYVSERERVNELEGFSVLLHKEDTDILSQRIQGWWSSLSSLVRETFSHNLPDHMFENDWSTLENNKIFAHNNHIPLPRSNSPIAKQMRMVVVLGNIARLAHKYVLQPTYIFKRMEELRELLNYEVSVDPIKERFLRGMLLSMSPAIHKEIANKAKRSLKDALEKEAGLRDVLDGRELGDFTIKLDSLLEEVQEIWELVQCNEIRLEHGFSFGPEDNHIQWQKYEFDVADGQYNEPRKGPERNSKKQKAASNTAHIADDDGFWIIIPPLYRMGGRPQPITPGIVLCDSQITAAMEEDEARRVKKESVQTPFSPEVGAVTKTKGSRRGSVQPTSPTAQRFLAH